jgi:phage terminase small subunit
MTKTPSLPAPALPAIENCDAGLTAKQIAFCDHYARYRNATQAYTAAFDTNASYDTRRNEGYKLLARADIQEAIKARSLAATAATGVDVGWLLNHFLAIATADPRELIGLKVGCCRFCYGEGHLYQWREREYLEAIAKAEFNALNYPDRKEPLPDIAGGFGYNATHPPHPDCPQCHGEGQERFVPRDTDNLSDQA